MSALFTPSDTHTYAVTGMTCDHCVRSVTEEVSALAGVESVDADLRSGQLRVTGVDVRDEAVRAAVTQAGYEMIR